MSASGSLSAFVNMALLIDDNETDNFIHSRIIEITAFAAKIEVKESAIKALEFLQQNQDNHRNLPEIIFLDLNMPYMNGYDFLAHFEKLSDTVKNKCRICVLSSSDHEADIARIQTNPFVSHYFTKPLSVQALDELKQIFR